MKELPDPRSDAFFLCALSDLSVSSYFTRLPAEGPQVVGSR